MRSSRESMSRERRKVDQGQNLREILEGKGSPKSENDEREVKAEPEQCGSIKARGAEAQRKETSILSNVCSILSHMPPKLGRRPVQLLHSLDQRSPHYLGISLSLSFLTMLQSPEEYPAVP